MTSPTPAPPPPGPFQAAFYFIKGIVSFIFPWASPALQTQITYVVLLILTGLTTVVVGFPFFLLNYDGNGNIRSGAQSFRNDVQNWLNRRGEPSPSPSPTPTPTATPTEGSETPTPSIEDVVATITSPEDGSTVSQSTTITGTISGLQSPMRAFLVVFSIWSPDEQIWWAEEIIPEEDASWVIEDAYREENFERIGHEFRTFVALTDDPEVAERILASEDSTGSAKIVTNWTTTRLADTPERVVRGHYDLLERYCNGEEDITPESRSVYLRTPASVDSPDPCTNFATIRLEEPPELLVREARDDGNTAYVTACTLWLPEGEDESSFPGEWRYLTLIQEPSTQIWQIDKMENSSNPGNCRE
jgi:hypothetical protein